MYASRLYTHPDGALGCYVIPRRKRHFPLSKKGDYRKGVIAEVVVAEGRRQKGHRYRRGHHYHHRRRL
jgi:hypothetical protein